MAMAMMGGQSGSWSALNTILARSIALALATCAICSSTRLEAQAMPTATRLGDLEIGGGVALGASTYNFTTSSLLGESAFAALDIGRHWGGELDFHNVKDTGDSSVYERTYEIGPRYHVTRGPFVPYAKATYGRGVYNFHNSVANIAYNIFTVGGGADWRVLRSWNIRADYEYQTWPGFPLNTLHPQVVTIGIAFHFHE